VETSRSSRRTAQSKFAYLRRLHRFQPLSFSTLMSYHKIRSGSPATKVACDYCGKDDEGQRAVEQVRDGTSLAESSVIPH